MSTNYRKVFAYGAVLAGVALAACGSGPMVMGSCQQGAEDCPCYGNMTCNSGLACLSNLCVNPNTGNGGHGGATGAGGMTGLAGTSGGGLTGGAGMSGGAGTVGATGTAGTSGGAGNTGAGGTSTASTNLIKNGDFSKGNEYWKLNWQAGDVAADNQAATGEYCIGNPSPDLYLSYSLGYPGSPSDAFSVAAGATYTLSFSAYVNSPTSVIAKIGQVESPYNELGSANISITSSNPTTFTQQITAVTSDPTAGLVFNGTLYYGATICFDNVSLVKN